MFHLAILIQGTEDYGVKRFVLSLVRELSRKSHKVSVISLYEGDLSEQCKAGGADVYCLSQSAGSAADLPADYGGSLLGNLGVGIGQVFGDRKRVVRFAKVLKEIQADVLLINHSHLLVLTGRAHQASCLGKDLKLVWFMPNSVSCEYPLNINKVVYKWLLRRFQINVIANSDFTASTLEIPSEQRKVVHLGVDSSEFKPANAEQTLEIREQLGFAPEASVFGIFARLVPFKGQLNFLRGLKNYLDNREAGKKENIVVLLGGGPVESPYVCEMKKFLADNHMSSMVKMIGNVADPQRYLPACDVLCNTRVDGEPFGLSVIEAMMVGRPVLVHALGGPAETVIDNVTGWHAKDASAEEYGRVIASAMKAKEAWITMGIQARKHAESEYSTTKMADKFCHAVQEICGV